MQDKKTKIMKGAIIFGILILPLIYSIVYLGGFWDPYGNLEGVPIALVNEDKCEKNCKGTQLVDKLTEKNIFDFDVVSKEKAESGLINKKYYAVITIPENFTESFSKASTEERQETTITYSPNKKTSYLASQIINSAMNQIETELHAEVTKEVVDNLSNNLKEVPNQTKQIETGLQTLGKGSEQLNDGTKQLKLGTNNLNNSYKAFDNGINELYLGLNTLNKNYKTLDDGLNTLYSTVHNNLIPQVQTNMNTLTESVNKLKTGSNNLTNNIQNTDYQNQINSFMDNSNLLYQNLNNMCDNGTLNDQTICMIVKGYTSVNPQTGKNAITTLKEGTNTIVTSQNQINNGIDLLNSSLTSVNTLTSGLNTLDQSILKIKNGSNEIYEGINKLNTGMSALVPNSSKISNGISTIDSSVSTLNNGMSTLNNGLNKAQTEVSNKIEETNNNLENLNGLSDYTSQPVKIKEKDYGQVDQYGTFFAPYFMSLSLWMGGILILIGLYYDPDSRFKLLGRNTNNRGLRLLIYNGLGVVQALILGFVLKTAIGYSVTNNLLYYGSCILISISFLSIIMFLFFNFKDVGKFLAIVLLVLQLAASGGTFPIETEPTFYQTIFPFMPMKYSIELLRESFVNIDSQLIIKNVTVLIGILIVFGGITLLIDYFKTKKTKKNKKDKNLS